MRSSVEGLTDAISSAGGDTDSRFAPYRRLSVARSSAAVRSLGPVCQSGHIQDLKSPNLSFWELTNDFSAFS